MSTVVERNDVDLSPLFSWSKKFEVVSNNGITPVYMRLLGDADMGRARVASLRRSAELRKKLKDDNTDEHIAFIKDIDEMEKEVLTSLVIVFSMRDLSDRAKEKVRIKPPKAPRSDAKTSAHEKYQEEVDSYPKRRQEEFRKLMDKELEIMKQALEAESKENLYKKYVNSMIDELCEQELLNAFKEWCAYMGSFKDENLSEKLFSSFDEFSNLEPRLKAQFITEYSTMELHGDDLKKLQQVTP